jgi:hypothetical protein
MAIRSIERKDWRNIVESCLNVQNTLKQCVSSSDEFNSLNKDNQHVLLDGIDRNLFTNYVESWRNENHHFSSNNLAVHDTNSKLWTENYENMNTINTKCNLFSFYEAIEGKVNLMSFNEK